MYQNLFGNPQNWKQNQANKSPQNPNMNKPNGNQKIYQIKNMPTLKFKHFLIMRIIQDFRPKICKLKLN